MKNQQQAVGNVRAMLYYLWGLTSGKRLFKNALFNSGSFLVNAVVGFVTLPFFVAKLGAEQFGIYVLVTSLFGYYGIFDLGIGQGLIRFVSGYSGNKHRSELKSGIGSSFWLQLLIGLFVSLLLYVNAQAIGHLLNVGESYLDVTTRIIRIASVGFLFSSISAIFSSCLMGLQLYTITAKAEAFNSIGINIVSVAMLIQGVGTLEHLVLVTVIFSLLMSVLYYVLLQKHLGGLSLAFQMNGKLLKQFLAFSIHIFFSKISNLFAGYIVKFIVGFFAGPAAVTYFTVPQKLVAAFGGLMSSAGNTLMPYVSTLQAEQRYEKIRSTMSQVSFVFSAVGIPVALFIVLYSKPIMTLWMGPAFAEKTWVILALTCLSSTVGSFSTIPNQVVVGTGNSRLLGLFSVLTVISYCLFLPLLTKYYLTLGAATGLLLTSVLLILVVIKKVTSHLHISFQQYISDVFGPHLLPAIIFTGFGVLSNQINQTSTLANITLGVAGLLAYFSYLVYSRRNFLRQLFLKPETAAPIMS